ncbi:DUF488 family protein [Thalassococcus sp. S3]|uniref:DUF488 domain-containing protein n=1 Tax=Thalassococcus sp. S3 TaxID=2017482 RepID=UPI001023FD8C|nr:DUF488 domain-containing protein [Thalassococcus sp. S3]QBF32825.1 hypothetical protein CFI11_16595 [Thalassococcus sp. S3]
MKDGHSELKLCPEGTAKQVFTIGYEGTEISGFVEVLIAAGIETLVDIRELPLSRKRGFSKNGLRTALEENGISYVHMRDLGDPKEGRLAARAGDYATFQRVFSDHMKTERATTALRELNSLVGKSTVCLLCFEKCHLGCHRSIVVEHLMQLDLIEARHI